jgi:NADPH-dependent curcumin reductase CurA
LTQKTLDNPQEVSNMNQNNTVNRRIVLNSRPVGAPTAENFRLEACDVPVPAAPGRC